MCKYLQISVKYYTLFSFYHVIYYVDRTFEGVCIAVVDLTLGILELGSVIVTGELVLVILDGSFTFWRVFFEAADKEWIIFIDAFAMPF